VKRILLHIDAMGNIVARNVVFHINRGQDLKKQKNGMQKIRKEVRLEKRTALYVETPIPDILTQNIALIV
jgi:hypothetical protein